MSTDDDSDPGAPQRATDRGRSSASPLPASLVLPTTAPPLDVDGTTAVAIGTVLWGVAGLVLLVFFRERLADAGTEWWLWTCLAGFGLGLVGYGFCRRRRDRA